MSQKRPELVLASGSPRRRELLEGIGLTFRVESSDVDETIHVPLPPAQVVKELAERKAQAVAMRLKETSEASDDPPCIVIGADTVVAVGRQVLGKPADRHEAQEMLTLLQGRTHSVFSGLCIIDVASGRKEVGFSSTDVTFRPMSVQEIDHYIDTGEPMDKAGAYGIQGLGSTLVAKISGDYFTVVGLPLCMLAQYLKGFGVTVI